MADILQVQTIDQALMAEMTAHAAKSERKRVHLLLHAGHGDQVQRLLIFMQVGTYVRPHCHPTQWEMLVLLQGQGDLLRFGADGRLEGRIEMGPQLPVVQIPAGAWHGFVVRAPDTVVMELKPGPYQPSEFADWAPPEGDPEASRFLETIAA
jgi:cupin fold WbuC family metalloprotein